MHFLEHVSAELFDNTNPSTDVQKQFDLFYNTLLNLFNNYYPLTITLVLEILTMLLLPLRPSLGTRLGLYILDD